MQVFKDNDAAYEGWLDANPHGFVLNSYRSPQPGYLILHRATCSFISRTAEPPVRWTTGDYIKICANNVSEIESWCREEAGASPQPCGMCRP